MLSEGEISVAFNGRFKHIVVDKIEIDTYPDNMDEQDPLFLAIKRRWIPFVSKMYTHFSAIGVCPFRIKSYTFIGKNEEALQIKYPIALEPFGFTLKTTMENGEKKYEFTVPNEEKKEKIYYVVDNRVTGPNAYKNMIDSDCGKLINQWITLQEMYKHERAMAEKREYPPLYVLY